MTMLLRLACLLLLTLFAPLAHAAEAEWDPRLVRGTLDNGLTYILHDSGKPTDPFNIRLIVHAGSVDEDKPSGIAHMLEHMVFQSNKAHPQGMHRYIQDLGWRQGLQVNAVTRESETQYMIRTRPDDALDLAGALAFTADLAFGATLRSEDWAKERFVILEELRQGNSVADRVNRQKKSVLRVGSRYADRSTIGTKETIENASIEDIRSFYDRFYIASNMTLVVSGRIDTAAAKVSIGRLFGAAPARPKPDRFYLDLPLKAGLSTGVVQDPAGSSSQTTYAFRMAMPERSSEEGQFAYLQKYFLTRLIRDAFQAQAPHYAGTIERFGFVAQETTEHRLILAFNASGPDHDAALPVLLEAIERVRRTPIAPEQFETLMASARRINDNNIKAAGARTYAEWEDRITSAVLTGSVLSDPARKAARTRALLDRITLAGLDAKKRDMLASSDQVLFYQVPGGKDVTLPAISDIAAIRDDLAGRPTLPALPPLPETHPTPKAAAPSWPVDANVPQTGAITARHERENPKITEWTLSNGDRMVWLVRNTPDGKVYLSGQSAPGFMNAEFGSTASQLALQLWTQSGFRFWTQEDFDHWQEAEPAGEKWSYALKADMLDVAVAASPDRLPALFSRYAQNIAFGTIRPQAVEDFRQQGADLGDRPDEYAQLLYGADDPTGVDMASLDAEPLETVAKALLAQPVTWVAVGPAPDQSVQDGFAKTIGAVPRRAPLTSAPALQRPGLHLADVDNGADLDRGADDRAQVRLSFFTPMNWTPEKSFLVSALNPVAQQALKEELRYRLGGIYTLQFELELDAASNRAIGRLTFYCAPERAQELVDAALRVLQDMPEIADRADTARIRADIAFAENGRLGDPNTWLRRLALSYRRYGDPGYLRRMETLPERLTQPVFKAQASDVFNTENLAILVSKPGSRAEP